MNQIEGVLAVILSGGLIWAIFAIRNFLDQWRNMRVERALDETAEWRRFEEAFKADK
tara:strand:+ start:1363 stop:1533 length:171 start_codon:yes stop_codon:yes gene_type:complete